MTKAESKYFNTASRMDEAFLSLLQEKDFAYITVKEICAKAGVNRSTFYLHYETIVDLLDESIAYMNSCFTSYFDSHSSVDIKRISTADMAELYLITPQYLLPYLRYVKENNRLFEIAIEKTAVLRSDSKMENLARYVFNPIMERYCVPQEKRAYILSFYIEGMIGVIKQWIKGGCAESEEQMAQIIIECVQKPTK